MLLYWFGTLSEPVLLSFVRLYLKVMVGSVKCKTRRKGRLGLPNGDINLPSSSRKKYLLPFRFVQKPLPLSFLTPQSHQKFKRNLDSQGSNFAVLAIDFTPHPCEEQKAARMGLGSSVGYMKVARRSQFTIIGFQLRDNSQSLSPNFCLKRSKKPFTILFARVIPP